MNEIYKRQGRFTIPEEAVIENPDALMELVFSKTIIARAEFLAIKKAFEYYAWSNEFDVIGLGEMVPTYIVEISNDENGNPSDSKFARQ